MNGDRVDLVQRVVLQHVDASVLEWRGALGTDQQQVVRVETLDEPCGAAEP
jgi:hypothetical protein